MNIIYEKTSEQKAINALVKSGLLPEGTRLVMEGMGPDTFEKGEKRHRALKSYAVQDSKLVVQHDFVDHDRPATKKEIKELEESVTKEKVIDFFLHQNEDDFPYRVYSFYSGAVYNYWDRLRFDCRWNETNQTCVTVHIERKDDPQYVLDQLNDILPEIIPFDYQGDGRIGKPLKIMEHTLSYHYSYGFVDYGDSVVLFSSYREDKTFPNWIEALKYCQIHHPYDSPEEKYEETW